MGKSKRGSNAPLIGGAATDNDISAYQAELMGAPLAQSRAIGQALELERGLLPTLQSHYFGNMASSAAGVQGLYNSLQQGSIDNQGSYGNALLGMYGNLGANATLQARNSLSPNVSRMYDTFTSQAADDLALGTQLSSQETDIAQGAARAAATARGLNFSRQGGDLEILNTYNMGQQRLNQRRQVAGQAYQMGRDLQNYGAQSYLTPAMQGSAIYSIPGLIGGAEGAIESYGPQTLQMESQYMANLRNGRIQGQLAQDQAAATKQAGIMSGLAGLGMAAITKWCWVAREVYGEENPKWLAFREWLVTSSPDWFFNLYTKHGEEFAEFISDKPFLKSIVRKTMDTILKVEEKRITNKIYA